MFFDYNTRLSGQLPRVIARIEEGWEADETELEAMKVAYSNAVSARKIADVFDAVCS